ncbi:hypothetical protein RS130_20100 [Paraglaciecola aquimarina]|uniref:Peptidase A2 domain-containing protein n=1 Tax=Paraglaciecola aquimarina TaxID=1235557 RepID=A0ABU3T0Z5_9ALTE|nr:hypothetical protein [Paraglaciecola aquimarina]MDU0355883.1 hypothetical protein [Paraglaciecola aquimarina]
MKKWLVVLTALCVCSISLNIYLLRQGNIQQELELTPPIKRTASLSATNIAPALASTEPLSKPNHRVSAGNALQQITQLNRDDTLAQANQLFAEKRYHELSALLTTYLKLYPQDMDFLLLEAKVKVETGLLSDALAHYYTLLRYPMTATQQAEIENIISNTSSNTIEQLQTTYSREVLAKFVEPLLQIDPENRLYIVSLARAYAEQFQGMLMENILASLPFEDPSAMAIRHILDSQQDTSEQNITQKESVLPPVADYREIALQQVGDQYVVNAELSNNHLQLLIDTGASITAISKQYFASLSSRFKKIPLVALT